MRKEISGMLDARGRKFAIVAGRFNNFITVHLIEGAVDCLARHGADPEEIVIVRVPGAFEIPLAAQKLAEKAIYDGIICVGAVIRGSTPHFEYVAAEVSKGIAHVSLKCGIPVAFGVLTTDTIEQSVERAGTKAGNKGWEAALSAIEMVALMKSL